LYCKVTRMSLKSLLILVPCALFSICLFAQKKKKGYIPNRVVCNYGDVKPADFAPAVYPIDSSAEAVYLFNGARSDFEGNQKSDFDLLYNVHTRIRILKKNAFHLATVEIPLYVTSSFQQRLEEVKATTYTISGGSVAAQTLGKNDFFQEKRDDHHQVVKFTLSNLSEGCIIEYSYTLRTPSGPNNLFGWTFQKDYPVLWSEYEVNYPLMFDYIVLKQGYHPFAIDTAKITRGSYLVGVKREELYGAHQDYSVSANVADCIWAMKDVPTLKREPFTTTLGNHIARIDFQLSTIRYSDNDVRSYMQSWNGASDTLLHNEFYYGKAFDNATYFLNDDVKTATAGAATKLEQAKKIYEFVRDNYTCVETYPWLKQPLRKVYQSKKGNTAEINMLLAAMLSTADFQVNPVLLSTAEHGKAYRDYPILDKYNYTICELEVEGKKYLLDAANSKLGFNKLSAECYNGYARVINKLHPELIDLAPDSLREASLTSVFMVNDKDGKLVATVTNTKGYEESLQLREKLSKESQDGFFKRVKNAYSGEIAIANEKIDSLKNYDAPVRVRYDLTMNMGEDEIIYFNPMLFVQQKGNPFTATERYYPVEMPYCLDESYVLDMEIPDGYTVDELPKSTRVMLNEKEGMFEYLIAKNGNHVQMRSRIKLEKAIYEPEDYQTLRDFYTYVVKKEAEQVVFKKVK
jgi:hypothetical protein